jgi:2-polyprenyl-3-methyl-5-hydroxy-6-metoxy-1,4-benzoquinol methylase
MTDFGRFSAMSTGSADEYKTFIKQDPYRIGLHYPAILKEIGDLRNKRVLDVGTGDGLFPRLMAKEGASVVGYDHNPAMIAKAQQHEDAARLNVKYVEAKPQTFSEQGFFDAATSIMVLPYAADIQDLTAFFRSTHKHLAAGAFFYAVILNPSFSAFARNLIIRRITRLEGNEVQMEFLEETSGDVKMQAVLHQYTKDEYEHAAESAGMTPHAWKALFATREAIEVKGEKFWQPCHEEQPYALFIAQKR